MNRSAAYKKQTLSHKLELSTHHHSSNEPYKNLVAIGTDSISRCTYEPLKNLRNTNPISELQNRVFILPVIKDAHIPIDIFFSDFLDTSNTCN
jgi:hypothetical protein